MLTSADIQSTKQRENRRVVVVVKITTCSRGFVVKAFWLSSLKEQESKPHRSFDHQVAIDLNSTRPDLSQLVPVTDWCVLDPNADTRQRRSNAKQPFYWVYRKGKQEALQWRKNCNHKNSLQGWVSLRVSEDQN